MGVFPGVFHLDVAWQIETPGNPDGGPSGYPNRSTHRPFLELLGCAKKIPGCTPALKHRVPGRGQHWVVKENQPIDMKMQDLLGSIDDLEIIWNYNRIIVICNLPRSQYSKGQTIKPYPMPRHFVILFIAGRHPFSTLTWCTSYWIHRY